MPGGASEMILSGLAFRIGDVPKTRNVSAKSFKLRNDFLVKTLTW